MEQVNNAVSLINSIKDIHTETGFKQIHIITSYSILSQYFHNKCLKYLKVINVYITQSWSIFEHSEVLAMIFEVGFVWYLRSWRTPPPTLWSLSPLMWVTGRRVLTALTQSLPAEFFRSPQISMKMRAIQPTGSTSWVRWGVMVNVEGHLVYDKLQKINLKWLLWRSIKFCLLRTLYWRLFGCSQEHFNYCGQDVTLGPLLLSLKEETTENGEEAIRCVLR